MDEDTNKANGILLKAEIPNREGWVDARSLHQKLGVKTLFPTWIKARIKRYGFIQEVDYQISLNPCKKPRGKMLTEYAVSPEIARKLTMVEQSYRNCNANPMKAFNFNGRRLRVIARNGELWFATKDIVHILGLSQYSSSVYILGDEDRTTIFTPNERSIQGINSCQILSEFGLLYVAFRSDMPQATEISKWLINEALPKIRKAYAAFPSFLNRFRQFIKSLCKQPETLPLCDRPGFPVNLPPKEAQDERA
jgi:phage anti-repressor protein